MVAGCRLSSPFSLEFVLLWQISFQSENIIPQLYPTSRISANSRRYKFNALFLNFYMILFQLWYVFINFELTFAAQTSKLFSENFRLPQKSVSVKKFIVTRFSSIFNWYWKIFNFAVVRCRVWIILYNDCMSGLISVCKLNVFRKRHTELVAFMIPDKIAGNKWKIFVWTKSESHNSDFLSFMPKFLIAIWLPSQS